MADYGKADDTVRELADKLWGNVDGEQQTAHVYGSGLVLDGLNMQEALDRAGVAPDVILEEDDPVLFIHRTLPDGDIYFISNQHDAKIELAPTFRITGKQPELWDAVSGTLRDLPEFTEVDGGTTLPLQLHGYESAFIIFRKSPGTTTAKQLNFPKAKGEVPVSGSWQCSFPI